MSILAYGALTRAREQAATKPTSLHGWRIGPGDDLVTFAAFDGDEIRLGTPKDKVTINPPKGISTFTDALIALLPAELIAAHAAILSIVTKSVPQEPAEGVDPETLPTVVEILHPGWVEASFYLLLLASLILYWITHGWGNKDTPDLTVRMWIPLIATAAWLMAIDSPAYELTVLDLPDPAQYIVVVFVALILAPIAAKYADVAQEKLAPGEESSGDEEQVNQIIAS